MRKRAQSPNAVSFFLRPISTELETAVMEVGTRAIVAAPSKNERERAPSVALARPRHRHQATCGWSRRRREARVTRARRCSLADVGAVRVRVAAAGRVASSAP